MNSPSQAEPRAPSAAPPDRAPDSTPADGPDPYGNREPDWLGVDWSAHQRWIEVGADRVNLVELGSGAPILFIHGLSGCWQNWLENLGELASSHRVIAFDLPGFGHSPMPDWDLSVANYARFIEDLGDRLDLGDVALVGSSMGGFIAAEVAVRDPGWVSSLVLVSAAGISSTRLKRRPVEVAARMTAAVSPLALEARQRLLRRPRIRRVAFGGVFYDPLAMRTEFLYEQWNGATGASGFPGAFAELVEYDFRDRLEAIRVPSMIVWGRNDRVVPPRDASAYKRLIPHARLEVFDRCGHLPMAERPARFNRLLSGFVGAAGEGPATEGS